MRVMLGSGGFRTPERVAFLVEQMRSFFGSIEYLLFVPYALADYDAYLDVLHQRGLDAGYRILGIHQADDPVAAVRTAPGLYIGGGNTFRLLATLYQQQLLDPIRDRVHQGMPYLGISAGCNVACPTIRTTNDMPITSPPSLDALGLASFQVNPHYYHGETLLRRGEELIPHFGETRDERLKEYHEMNSLPIVGLWEGGILRIENNQILLLGTPARLFRRGQPCLDVEPGTDLTPYLQPGD